MTATATYLLDDLPVDLDRLINVAEVLAPEVRSACQRAGLRAGGRALDAGCGPLGALAVLRDVVGPGGQVVGLDASPASLAAARTVLSRLGGSEVTLVAGDINAVGLGTLGGPASFDLVFSRLTLMHQPDPEVTTRRLGQLLRPGGALVAFDLFAPPVTEPGYPPLERAWQLLMDGMRERGAHPETSRRYAELTAAAGLRVVSQRGAFFPVPPAATLAETRTLLTAASASLTGLGLATAAGIDDLIARLAPERAPLRYATTPMAVELIARKPG
jgi:SAM-dependent methyltransferase